MWDPTYVDESWIGTDVKAPPIQLIPRFRSWIGADYPGTKLAITEYNFGGLESMNGALAQADVLGIFGREKVDLATLWAPPTAGQPGAFAFRMYRNYDGRGSTFGDTSVSASSTDQGQLAVYAAQRTADHALTVMVVNKASSDLTSTLHLSGMTPSGTAQRYTYSSANLTAIVRRADLPVTPAGWTATYPANSVTLLVVPDGGADRDGDAAGGGHAAPGGQRRGSHAVDGSHASGRPRAGAATPLTAATPPGGPAREQPSR